LARDTCGLCNSDHLVASGKTLAVSSAAGEVMLADLSGEVDWPLLPPNVGGNSIDCLAFSRDGQNLLLAVKMDK